LTKPKQVIRGADNKIIGVQWVPKRLRA
jgi:hypothetical protein